MKVVFLCLATLVIPTATRALGARHLGPQLKAIAEPLQMRTQRVVADDSTHR